MLTLYMLSAADMSDMARKMWRYARGLFRSERVVFFSDWGFGKRLLPNRISYERCGEDRSG